MKEIYVVFKREHFLLNDYHDTPMIFFSKKEDAEKEITRLVDKKVNKVTYHVELVTSGDIKQQLTPIQQKLNFV